MARRQHGGILFCYVPPESRGSRTPPRFQCQPDIVLQCRRQERAAALIEPWSTSPVEGQINRLKMLKRQMYGRANLDLLSRRFLLLAADSPKVAKNPI